MKIVNLSSVFGSCGSQRQGMMTARKVGGRVVGRRRCRFIWMGWVLWLTGFVVGLPHGKVGKGGGRIAHLQEFLVSGLRVWHVSSR